MSSYKGFPDSICLVQSLNLIDFEDLIENIFVCLFSIRWFFLQNKNSFRKHVDLNIYLRKTRTLKRPWILFRTQFQLNDTIRDNHVNNILQSSAVIKVSLSRPFGQLSLWDFYRDGTIIKLYMVVDGLFQVVRGLG